MSLTLTIFPDAKSLNGLIGDNPCSLAPVELKPFVAGDNYPVVLRLVDSDGEPIDPTGYTFRVGLGPINKRPTGGHLTIDDGANTATIPAMASVGDVKHLLDQMGGGVGIYGKGQCTVSGDTGGPWFVTVGDVGAIALPTIDVSGLTPPSLANAAQITEGTPTTKAQFIVRAFQQPLAYQDQWVVNGDQVEGILNLGTEGVYRVLSEGVTSYHTTFEVELTYPDNTTIKTVVQVPVWLMGEVIGLGAGGKNDFSSFLTLDQANELYVPNDGMLEDGDGVGSVDWHGRQLYDSQGRLSVDWENRLLLRSNGQEIANWEGTQGFLYLFRGLRISSGTHSEIALDTGVLRFNNTTRLDWNNRTFLGEWQNVNVQWYAIIDIPIPIASGMTDFELCASEINFTPGANPLSYRYYSPNPESPSTITPDGLPDVYFTDSGYDTPSGGMIWRKQATGENESIKSMLTDADSVVGGIVVVATANTSWFTPYNRQLNWSYRLLDGAVPNEDNSGRSIWQSVANVRWTTQQSIPNLANT